MLTVQQISCTISTLDKLLSKLCIVKYNFTHQFASILCRMISDKTLFCKICVKHEKYPHHRHHHHRHHYHHLYLSKDTGQHGPESTKSCLFSGELRVAYDNIKQYLDVLAWWTFRRLSVLASVDRTETIRLKSVVKLWRNATFPFRLRRENVVSLVYTTTVGERLERGIPPRPLRHQLKSKYGQLVAQKPEVLLYSSDTTVFCGHKMHKIWSVDSQENY